MTAPPVTLPDAPWRHREGLQRLLSALGAEQGETRYVGGCVRDTLLGMNASDVDLATRLQPDEVIDRLRRAKTKAIPTGIAPAPDDGAYVGLFTAAPYRKGAASAR